MSEQNPYASPSSNLTDQTPGTGAVSRLTVEHLRRTKPWARLFSVCFFIGAIFMIFAGIMMFLGSAAAFSSSSRSAAFGSAGMGAVGFFYILLGLLYFYPSLKVFKYASRIDDLLFSGSVQDLEAALLEQMKFWRFVGILCIIGIAFFVLTIGLGIIGAMVR